MFYFEEIDGKKILKSTLIKNAFFTTRESVIKSKEPEFESLLNSNKVCVKDYLGVEKLISPSQTHTSNIQVVNSEIDNYPETDALILTEKNIGIFLNFADCTPIILYDKARNIGAIAHGGWRGTVGKIAQKTALKMIENFQCEVEDISAVIGPCISKCCFEVGTEVYQQLYESINQKVEKISQENVFADLKYINRIQLEQVGIKNIDVCPYCTVCNNDLFFSYRKENGTTNRHSAVLKLN